MIHPDKTYPYSFNIENGKYVTVYNPNFVFRFATEVGIGTDIDMLQYFFDTVNDKITKEERLHAKLACFREFVRLNGNIHEKI